MGMAKAIGIKNTKNTLVITYEDGREDVFDRCVCQYINQSGETTTERRMIKDIPMKDRHWRERI